MADLFADLVRVETRLFNALDATLRERHAIPLGSFEFLRFIRDRGSVRVADLAVEFAIGVGATSKGIDRMEAKGWIERIPNPANRRSSLIVLTDVGAQLLRVALPTFRSELSRLTADLDAPALQALADALGTLRRGLEGEQIGQPAG